MKKSEILAAFTGAIIAGIISIGVSIYTSYENRLLEKDQFESNLILKAIDTKSIDSSKRNLRFLIEGGFISKDNEKIKKVIIDSILEIKFPKETILIPQNDVQVNEFKFITGKVTSKNNKPLNSVTVFIHKNTHKIDTFSFSKTTTDINGIYSLPIPNDKKVFKISFTKLNYTPFSTILSKNMILNSYNIKLDSLK